MSTDWWAKKLQTQQPVAGIRLPPQQQYLPQQPQYVQQAPQYVQQAPQQVQQHDPVQDDPNRKLSLREAVSRFSGGESARVEGHLSCPQCGSRTGYTEYRGMGGLSAGVMGNRPAPHCYECGYNGRFAQGEQANWTH